MTNFRPQKPAFGAEMARMARLIWPPHEPGVVGAAEGSAPAAEPAEVAWAAGSAARRRAPAAASEFPAADGRRLWVLRLQAGRRSCCARGRAPQAAEEARMPLGAL